MMARCYKPACGSYKYYGGLGITVCDRWRDYPNFLADIGVRPLDKTLDRIDSNKNYEPSNCRWATAFEQNDPARKHKRK